jgi:predicted TIM-barrel fold metal-dependent hydrolase
VIDADGHFVEIGPVMEDEILSYLEESGGTTLVERYRAATVKAINTSTVLADRNDPSVRRDWRAMPSWWGWPVKNTRDRATAHLPQLLYERLDEMGIDFGLLYPSATISLLDAEDPELAGPVARAINRWFARLFEPYRDRMAVAAIVPLVTPEVAMGEVDYAVNELGMKLMVVNGYSRRYLADEPADGRRPFRIDTFGLDSEYDYDPLWAKCVELGIAPVSHGGYQYIRPWRSVTNYMYNHISTLSSGHEAFAKSLFFGGVTRRFPTLNFGFLEGGVAWACSLFADLVGHWEKRNGTSIHDLDPDQLDVDGLMEYMQKYGDDTVQANLDRVREFFATPAARPAELNEFAAAGVETADDLVARFVPRFYFGCEADDPLVTWAFNDKVNPLGARLRPLFGSDIAHWDVQDMAEPVEEAYEMVEKGALTEGDFKDFMFTNAVRLHAGVNPRFFEGTVVEQAAAAEIAKGLS